MCCVSCVLRSRGTRACTYACDLCPYRVIHSLSLSLCVCCVYVCVYGYGVCLRVDFMCFSTCICVYVCIVYLFPSLTMKYLTLSILFQFIEGEGIPTGGDRIGYTYTLTPIIKLSYFLFNRYKTTTALPWLFISTFVPSLVHTITSRACLSHLVTPPRLSFRVSRLSPAFLTRSPFKRTAAVPTQRRVITTLSRRCVRFITRRIIVVVVVIFSSRTS